MTESNAPINDSKDVHVGNERVNKIQQFAIDVSSASREHITRAMFMRHLLDDYGVQARIRWMQTLTESPAQPAGLLIEPHALVTAVNIYIGHEYFNALKQLSIDISADTRIQTTPTQVANHLIDHYSVIARDNWVKTLDSTKHRD